MDNFLAICASLLGIYQMNWEINEINKEISETDYRRLNFIMLSILINIIWLIHEYRNGSVIFTGYSLLGLVVQLYIFMVLFFNKPEKDAFWLLGKA